MRKKFKTKNTNKFKKISIILLVIFSIYITMGIIFNGKTINLKEILLNNSLNEMISDKKFISSVLDIEISTPDNIIYSVLNKVIDKNDLTYYGDDYFDYEKSDSEYVEDLNYVETKDPIVYIYNSHQLEEYNKEILYDYSVKPNVLIASYILKEKLESYAIPSIVETNNIKKYLNDNNYKYNYSYVASRYFAQIKLKENPTIKYLVDIHRDSALINKTLYSYNNKEYAKIMFVVGLDHANYEPNLELANNLNNRLNELYPGFSRGISKKTGKGVNGIYNQDLSEHAMLIEIGGVDNTIDQVNNSITLIAEILSKYIKEGI